MKKETRIVFGKKNYLLGTNKEGQKVWLEQGTWDCGWYWGIGYVEVYNKRYTDIDLHTHFDSLFLTHNLYDSYKEYFDETTLNDKEIWALLETMQTIYTLRKTSDMIHSKGSHISSTDIEKDLFDDETYKNLYNKINNEDIPKLLDEVYKLLSE